MPFRSREAHFFAEMGAESPLEIPECLYTSVSWFSNAFIIVMADVTPARELSDNDAAKRAFGKAPFDNSLSGPSGAVKRP